MRKSAILATVAVLALAGCGNGSTDEASADQTAASEQAADIAPPSRAPATQTVADPILEQIGKYYYEKSRLDCVGRSPSDGVCVSRDEWKALCEKAEGITNRAIPFILMTQIEINVMRSNGINDLSAHWDESKLFGCRARFNVSGADQGMPVDKYFDVVVSQFEVRRDSESNRVQVSISNQIHFGEFAYNESSEN
jgi:hypothetical protein